MINVLIGIVRPVRARRRHPNPRRLSKQVPRRQRFEEAFPGTAVSPATVVTWDFPAPILTVAVGASRLRVKVGARVSFRRMESEKDRDRGR